MKLLRELYELDQPEDMQGDGDVNQDQAVNQLSIGSDETDTDSLGSDSADVVKLDVPLFIRLLEWSREEATDDEQLHNVAEKLTADLNRTWTMDDYAEICGDASTEDDYSDDSEDDFNDDSEDDYSDDSAGDDSENSFSFTKGPTGSSIG